MDGQDQSKSASKRGSRKATHSSRAYTEGNEPDKPNTVTGEAEEGSNVKGEKTIVCWNCQTVLMVKEDWNVVQCTNCDKINRIPNAPTDVNNQIRLNDNLNHFDLYLPYVVRITFEI